MFFHLFFYEDIQMKYSNSEIKKNFIQLNNIEMTFDKNGIYLIHGENGSGKTTLLETILFDQKSCHFEFESEIEQEALRQNRYNLFSSSPSSFSKTSSILSLILILFSCSKSFSSIPSSCINLNFFSLLL